MFRSTRMRTVPSAASGAVAPGKVAVGASPGKGVGDSLVTVAVGLAGGGGKVSTWPAKALQAIDRNNRINKPKRTTARSFMLHLFFHYIDRINRINKIMRTKGWLFVFDLFFRSTNQLMGLL